MISQEEEIELIYKGKAVIFDCPGRRIVVRAVENHFGLKNVLFDDKCYPTDVNGLTFRTFGADVKSLRVTGELALPAGVLSCPIHPLCHRVSSLILSSLSHMICTYTPLMPLPCRSETCMVHFLCDVPFLDNHLL